jgi:FKBP-type peptidyl-prolyl cis-trans isomerase
MNVMRVAAVGILILGLAGCGGGGEDMGAPQDMGSLPGVGPNAPSLDMEAMTQTETGLQYQDLEVGTGEEAVNGMSVSVHYTGWLLDGGKFDSSVDRGAPFELTLPGQVIPGWNEGIPGMRVGGMRRLVIPPDLAYGEAGRPPVIPPSSTLIFDVKLLAAGG